MISYIVETYNIKLVSCSKKMRNRLKNNEIAVILLKRVEL